MRQRSKGSMMVDHRNSPGITPEFMARAGLDPHSAVPGGKTWESDVINCPHCADDVVLHPLLKKELEWCFACDEYICDRCGMLKKLGAPHKPYRQILGELYDELQRGSSR